MESSNVSAVLFVKDLKRLTAFYAGALDMQLFSGDHDHSVLHCRGFQLIVHQIPKPIADDIEVAKPPERRVWGAIRLDFSVLNIDDSRKRALSLGGDIDDVPPAWAERNAKFYFGYDPEGNQFGVRQDD
jgi:hypothetical protein